MGLGQPGQGKVPLAALVSHPGVQNGLSQGLCCGVSGAGLAARATGLGCVQATAWGRATGLGPGAGLLSGMGPGRWAGLWGRVVQLCLRSVPAALLLVCHTAAVQPAMPGSRPCCGGVPHGGCPTLGCPTAGAPRRGAPLPAHVGCRWPRAPPGGRGLGGSGGAGPEGAGERPGARRARAPGGRGARGAGAGAGSSGARGSRAAPHRGGRRRRPAVGARGGDPRRRVRTFPGALPSPRTGSPSP